MGKYLVLIIILSFIYVSHTAKKTPSQVIDISNAINLYKNYVKNFNKTFENDDEYYKRYLIFVGTLRKINDVKTNPLGQQVKLNKYADWTEEEKKALHETPVRRIDPYLKQYAENKGNIIETRLALPGTKVYDNLMAKMFPKKSEENEDEMIEADFQEVYRH